MQNGGKRREVAPGLRRRMHPGWPVMVALLAAAGNFNAVWNHFYSGVPKLFDTGWYAALVHRQTPLMLNPGSVVFGPIGESFHETHFSPALWLFSLPGYLFKTGPVVWLGIVEASKHLLLVLGVWATLRRLLRSGWPGPDREPFWAVIILILAPFSGVMLAGSAYPHFEIWLVPGAMVFLILLFRGHYGWASVAMGATVLVREDMGFHLFGLLLIAAMVRVRERRRLDREIRVWLGFACAGFLWSCLAIGFMVVFFRGDSAFGRIYLGEPPLAHLNIDLLIRRSAYLLLNRAYIWGPLLVYGIWALRSRRLWMLVGYAAFFPWFLLNFLAYQEVAATFSLYYSFPFALAALWPLPALLVFGEKPSGRPRLAWIAAALAVSVAGYMAGAEWRPLLRDMVMPRMVDREAIDEAVSTMTEAVKDGKTVAVDDAVAAFDADAFSNDHLFGQTPEGVGRVALFANGRSVQIAWETALSLRYSYRAGRTSVVILSNQPLQSPHLRQLSGHPESVLAFTRPSVPDFAWREARTAKGFRTISTGPEWFLPGPNPWEVCFLLSIESIEEAGRPVAICEVVVDGGQRVLASERISADDPAGQSRRFERTLRFELPRKISGGIEFRVWAADGTRGRIEDIRLRPVETAKEED